MDDIDLGKLKIGKEIGKGGYGIVYEATLTRIEHTVAVKVLDPSPFQGDRSFERFLLEAKMLLTLRHPHIISIYGLGVHDDKPYILMERFPGMNLYEARDSMIPTPSKILPFLRMIASALGYAHSLSIVHRDIKPSNLMTIRGDARVIDFGIAKLMDPNNERFTRTGGTPVGDSFSAPELLEDPRLLDARCDVYSLAACWYWLLTGKAPKGRNWEAALTALPDMTASYAAVVFKALDRMEKRFSSMEELADEVQRLQIGSSTKAHDEQFLDDHCMLVLGIMFEQAEPGDENVASFAIEKQLDGSMTKFRLKLTLKKLIERSLITTKMVSEYNEEYPVYVLTDEGKNWVSTHQELIARLLEERLASARPSTSVSTGFDSEEIPF